MARWSSSKTSRAQRGFSLMEVLVALAIFAVLASTIVLQTGSYGAQLFRLEEKSLALWAAQNALDALRIGESAEGSGRRSREVEMGGRTWIVTEKIAATNRAGFRRVDVDVTREGDEDPVLTLTGFVGPR